MDDDTRTTVLDIEGMTCASCVARVERRLNAIDGVEASVNLATESARIAHADGLDREELLRAVSAAGYTASVRPERGRRGPAPVASAAHADASGHDHAAPMDHGAHEGHEGHHASVSSARRVVVAAALAVPVAALGMIPALQFPGWQWVSLVLATPVVWWGGWPFHRATWRNLRHGALTMDTLISLGTSAAYLWSVWALLFGGAGAIAADDGMSDDRPALYFEVAAVVTVFLLLGRYLEDRARRRAGASLRALMELGAPEVELVDGRRIPTDALEVGDEFVVRPGETIATDGRVVEGRAAVDESMLTGESVPVDAGPGSIVTGGTIAQGGMLRVQATSVGADTRLARIADLIESAQAAKSRVQRLADRISAVFVPAVIVLAVLTLAAWLLLGQPVADGFTAAVAVLIIACPCALGLATPVAILVGSGRGAQLGILLTGPDAIDNADRIDTVVLDKTGTVTSGRMSVSAVTPDAGVDADRALAVAAALEAASEHPVARAVAAASADRPTVTDFAALAGAGVTGTVDGLAAFAGSPELARSFGPLSEALEVAVTAAGTVVVVGWGEPGSAPRPTAVIALTDAPRPEAAEVVAQLRADGLRVRIVSGDAPSAVASAARAVGVDGDETRARVTPEGKIAAVRALQAQGRRVAMVGDGVNDAAALAAADLGVAMGGGTDAAAHASDIALTGTDLRGVVTALRLSRRIMRVIRGNLFWAFAYNVAALPLAALGFLDPMIAGAAMAFSSLFVVLNSLRLRRASSR